MFLTILIWFTSSNCSDTISQILPRGENDLRSVPVCESIELVILEIQNNFKCVAHCYSKDICSFYFKGDHIVEAAKSGLRTGSLSVSTSMKMHT